MKKVILIISLFNCCACTPVSNQVENALVRSGSNREQLEQVIRHYSQNAADSLKRKAALFLIANMPGHTSVYGKEQEGYYRTVDSVIRTAPLKDRREQVFQFLSQYRKRLQIRPDIEIIRACFLIDNIEKAFDLWQNAPWAQHVDFEQFCEYLLPYKLAEEQGLEHWRDTFSPLFNAEWQKNQHCRMFKHSAYFNCKFVNWEMLKGIQSAPTVMPTWIFPTSPPHGGCGW